MAPHVQ